MAKKIEIIGNYFIITDTVSGETEIERGAKHMSYRDVGNTIFFYYGDKDYKVGRASGYVLSDFVDSSGSAFANQAALLTFLRTNTGTGGSTTTTTTSTDNYNVETYGALGDTIDLEDGNITSGTSAFSSASATFTSDDVGKTIAIKGAGTSGAYHVTTIATFVDANNITVTDNAAITVSSEGFFYGTDDTVNIQSAIQACFDGGGGVVYFPIGIYIIGGALLNNVGVDLVDYNSQLYIPQQDFQEQTVSIELVGEVHPHFSPSAGIGNAIGNNKGTVIRSTIQGSGTRPSIIASRGASGNAHGFNFTQPLFKNLTLQVTLDGSNRVTMGGINCEYSATANFDNVTAYPHSINLVNSGEPINDVVGIAMPKINCRHINVLNKVAVGGFVHGYLLGEHNSLYDVTAVVCVNAFTHGDNVHMTHGAKLSAFWCKNVFNIGASGQAYFNIISLQTEYDSQGKWYDSDKFVNDISNRGYGYIGFNIVEANVGIGNHLFNKSGGENILAVPIPKTPNKSITDDYSIGITDDSTGVIIGNKASQIDITIPLDSTHNLNIGRPIKFQQFGEGQLNFIGETGSVNIYSSESTKSRYEGSIVYLTKLAENEWSLSGDLESKIPELLSVVVEDSAKNSVIMTFDEIINGTNLGFSLSGTTSTSFSSITGFGTDVLTGVLANDVANGETVLLSYNSVTGDLENTRGNKLESFTNTAVTNNVGVGFADSLSAAYQFESNFNDFTTNHNATAIGTVTNSATGKVGNCATFDGTTDYLSVASHSDLSFGDGIVNYAAGITAWINLDTLSGVDGAVIANKRGGTSGTDEWILSVFGGEVYFTVYDKDSNGDRIAKRTTTTPITTGSWIHVAVTWDGTPSSAGINIYINGSLATSTDNSAGTFVLTNNGGANVVIGTRGWDTAAGEVDGKIDELKIYKDRELTAGEISSMYTSENAGTSVL